MRWNTLLMDPLFRNPPKRPHVTPENILLYQGVKVLICINVYQFFYGELREIRILK